MATAIEELGGDAVDLLELLAGAADGMVAIDAEGTILGWNEGAAGLLGYTEEEVLGRPCHEVLSWLDRCGNPVCSAFCPSCRGLGDDELVATRDVVARAKTDKTVWLSVSTLVPPRRVRRSCRLVHFFREVALPPELERLVAERLHPEPEPTASAATAALASLTPREREILALLAEGADTGEIALKLVVSVATVRNHVQNILGKLGVHSRLEAAVRFIQDASRTGQPI